MARTITVETAAARNAVINLIIGMVHEQGSLKLTTELYNEVGAAAWSQFSNWSAAVREAAREQGLYYTAARKAGTILSVSPIAEATKADKVEGRRAEQGMAFAVNYDRLVQMVIDANTSMNVTPYFGYTPGYEGKLATFAIKFLAAVKDDSRVNVLTIRHFGTILCPADQVPCKADAIAFASANKSTSNLPVCLISQDQLEAEVAELDDEDDEDGILDADYSECRSLALPYNEVATEVRTVTLKGCFGLGDILYRGVEMEAAAIVNSDWTKCAKNPKFLQTFDDCMTVFRKDVPGQASMYLMKTDNTQFVFSPVAAE